MGTYSMHVTPLTLRPFCSASEQLFREIGAASWAAEMGAAGEIWVPSWRQNIWKDSNLYQLPPSLSSGDSMIAAVTPWMDCSRCWARPARSQGVATSPETWHAWLRSHGQEEPPARHSCWYKPRKHPQLWAVTLCPPSVEWALLSWTPGLHREDTHP